MKIITVITVTLLLSVGVRANAADRTFADVYAECGLGALLFNQDGSSDNGRILAIISNATWDLGTTAHISNLSSEENCQGSSTTTAAFIYQNYDRIESDLAKGSGDHLAALLDNVDCPDQDATVTAMRAELANLVAVDEDSVQVAFRKSSTLYDSLATICTV